MKKTSKRFKRLFTIGHVGGFGIYGDFKLQSFYKRRSKFEKELNANPKVLIERVL